MSGKHHHHGAASSKAGEDQNASGTTSASAVGHLTTTTSHAHQIRKRHSPNTVTGTTSKKDETFAVESAAYSKLRKVSASNSSKANAGKHAIIDDDKAGESSQKAVKKGELKYLTDYFPETGSTSDFRLTRSRLKAATTTPGESSSKSFRKEKTEKLGKKASTTSASTLTSGNDEVIAALPSINQSIADELEQRKVFSLTPSMVTSPPPLPLMVSVIDDDDIAREGAAAIAVDEDGGESLLNEVANALAHHLYEQQPLHEPISTAPGLIQPISPIPSNNVINLGYIDPAKTLPSSSSQQQNLVDIKALPTENTQKTADVNSFDAAGLLVPHRRKISSQHQQQRSPAIITPSLFVGFPQMNDTSARCLPLPPSVADEASATAPLFDLAAVPPPPPPQQMPHNHSHQQQISTASRGGGNAMAAPLLQQQPSSVLQFAAAATAGLMQQATAASSAHNFLLPQQLPPPAMPYSAQQMLSAALATFQQQHSSSLLLQPGPPHNQQQQLLSLQQPPFGVGGAPPTFSSPFDMLQQQHQQQQRNLVNTARAAADLRHLASQLAAAMGGHNATGPDAALLQAAAANVMDLTSQMLAASNSPILPSTVPQISNPTMVPAAPIGTGNASFAPLPLMGRQQPPLHHHHFFSNFSSAAAGVSAAVTASSPFHHSYPSPANILQQQQQLVVAAPSLHPIGINRHQQQQQTGTAVGLAAMASSRYAAAAAANAAVVAAPPPAPQSSATMFTGGGGLGALSALGHHHHRPPSGTTGTTASTKAHHHLNRATSFLTGLVPRMQHLLSNSSASSALEYARGSNSSGGSGGRLTREYRGGIYGYMEDPEVAASAIVSTMEGLRSSNEIRQSEAATELAEMLLMGNEESLPGLPLREIVHLLMGFLQKDHNFELMLTAARCITNMQEALPRAITLLTDAIPLLLQKLKRIEYIDVAEQSLIALEVMSRRNAKNILTAGGISSTISHVDFFSMPSQRLAFSIAANCATYVTNNDFAFIKDCLGDLTNRLVFVEDKRCVESICLFFNRIIENVRHHPDRLRQIAGVNFEFLKNVQQLVTSQPLTVSSATFLSLLKSVRYMCTKCGDIAVALIKMDFGTSLQTLLLGHEKSAEKKQHGKDHQPIGFGTPTVDIVTRPPQQFREIIILTGELMPNFPSRRPKDTSTDKPGSGGATNSRAALADDPTSIDNQVSQFMSNYSTSSSSLQVQLRSAAAQMIGAAADGAAPGEIVEPILALNTWFAATAPVPVGGGAAEWIQLPQMVSDMLEQSRMLGEPQTLQEMDGEMYEVDFLRMVRRNTNTGVETMLECRPYVAGGVNSEPNRITGASSSSSSKSQVASAPQELDEREALRTNENNEYAKLVRMLLPLLVDIGTNSTCPNLRHELLRVMLRMVFAVESNGKKGSKEGGGLGEILRDIPLAVYLYNTISTSMTGSRNLGVLVNALRLAHLLLDKLPQLYIPLFETEGVFHELRKVTKLQPPITPSSSAQNLVTAAGTSITGRGPSAPINQLTSSSVGSTAAALDPGAPSTGATSGTSTRHHHRSTASIIAAFSRTTGANNPQTPTGIAGLAGKAQGIPASVFSQFLQQSGTTMTNPPLMFSTNSGIAGAIRSISGSSSSSQAKNLHEWSMAEATRILQKFTGDSVRKFGILPHKNASKVYEKLCSIAKKFITQGKDIGCEPLNSLKAILVEHDISAFQLNHSGIVAAINTYLADSSSNILPPRKLRLKRFAAVFMNITADNVGHDTVVGAKERFAAFECLINKVLHAVGQVEQFQVKITNLTGILPAAGGSATAFISAAGLFGTAGAGVGSGTGSFLSTTYLRGVQALRFFQTHQLRINLKRHPSVAHTPTKSGASGTVAAADIVREWRHGRGSIKVDPLTSVEKIERYLVERGLAGNNGDNVEQRDHSDESSENDEISDEEQDVSFMAEDQQQSHRHRVELYIGEHRLPSDIPIIQAIRQFALPQDEESQESIPATVWVMPHTVHYKPAANVSISSSESAASSKTKSPSPMPLPGAPARAKFHAAAPIGGYPRRTRHHAQVQTSATSSRGSVGTSSSGLRDAKPASPPIVHAQSLKDHPVFRTGQPPKRSCPLDKFLQTSLQAYENALGQDPSAPFLLLLNTLYGLNTYWWSLFVHESTAFEPTSVHSVQHSTASAKHHHRSKASTISIPSSSEDFAVLPLSHAPLLPLSVFRSSKLNSKVCRQLTDFLSVATQQIPAWTVAIVKAAPFIFSFSTRRSLLYCTAFGRDRALMHLCSESGVDEHDAAGSGAATGSSESASRLIHRLERRKVTINRGNLLKDAQNTLMHNLGAFRPVLEVGFEGEVGTGFGPTLEFYSTLSRALQKHSLQLWHGHPQQAPNGNEPGDESGDDFYTVAEGGLYPAMGGVYAKSLSNKHAEARFKQFEFIGRLLAQALIDSRMLDIQLSPAFFKWLLGEEESLGLDDFEKLEPTLYKSILSLSQTPAQDFGCMEIYFNYPGEGNHELMRGGRNIAVSQENFAQFADLICYWRLIESVRSEMEAVRRGFQMAVLNIDALKIFTADEMEQLFCGSFESSDETDKAWSKASLRQAIRPDHGFSHESIQIGWLVDMLHSYTREKRRRFLQFVTGSPRLPVGGFRALNPPLTVVRKQPASYATTNENSELPSAMTCYNYLKIPPYDTYEIFIQRFDVALEHVFSFYLT